MEYLKKRPVLAPTITKPLIFHVLGIMGLGGGRGGITITLALLHTERPIIDHK